LRGEKRVYRDLRRDTLAKKLKKSKKLEKTKPLMVVKT